MTFNEMVLATESETESFDKIFNQCVMFAEASYQEYKTNLKEAELKVIQESGTPEDLIYLESQAKEGFIVRAGKTIAKIVDSFLTWLKNIIKNIEEFLTGKKNKEALDKAEKAIQKNPKLKSKKVEIEDVNKMEKVCKKHEAMVDRKIAMFKAGRFTKKDKEELDEIEKSFEKEKNATNVITITVGLAAVLGIIKLTLQKMKKEEKEAEDDAEKLKSIKITETSDVEDVDALSEATSLKVRLKKELNSVYNNVIKKAFKSVKNHITDSKDIDVEIGKGDTDNEEDVKEESTIDEATYLDNLISEIEESAVIEDEENGTVTEESTQEETKKIDAEAYLEALESSLNINDEEEMVTAEEYLESMEAELFNEDDNVVTESEDEGMTAEEYLECLEAELFHDEEDEMTAEKYLDSLEAELFGE